MSQKQTRISIIHRDQLPRLFDYLTQKGYGIAAPVLFNNAITYDYVTSPEQLPIGWQDIQDNGRYRLAQTDSPTLFGYTLGPQTWKKFLYPPTQRLWQAERQGDRFTISTQTVKPPRLALLGVRPCELKALKQLDNALRDSGFGDSYYREVRKNAFIVAVNCTRAGNTCFCTSMGTGPGVAEDDLYDLALTEMYSADGHYFVATSGSTKGQQLLDVLEATPAETEQVAEAEKAIENASASMGRTLDTENLPELLNRRFDSMRWEKIAERCLTCGNCTLVCPTCFCGTVVDETDLVGSTASRSRCWDSCFTVDFSYIHGGSVRATESSRYRQWMMHKLAYWVEQFGAFGCVGCGRCITWCPVGIDITEEARHLREEG